MELLHRVVQAGFRQRRKQLHNGLGRELPVPPLVLGAAFAACCIDSERRPQTLSVEARPYLERARVLGGGHWHQMSRHVLPNVMPLVLANTTLTVAIAILSRDDTVLLRPR